MKSAVVAIAIVFLSARGASAHRLDEYLQATTISLEKHRVQAQIRLTPGVAVLPFVLTSIDTNGDGVISKSEQRAYAERVLRDLSLSVDGERLALRSGLINFPSLQQMKEGLGEIHIEFTADLPHRKSHRTLVFENHHQSQISAYLVNCLIPGDLDISVTAQSRNYQQSIYQLDYAQAGSGSLLDNTGAGERLLIAVMLFLCGRLVWLRNRLPTARIHPVR